MSDNWKDAARRYRGAKEASHAQQPNPLFEPQARLEEQVLRATELLCEFMRRHGSAALELLSASERQIIFGEKPLEDGYGEVYFLDGQGLRKSVEAMGEWVLSSPGDALEAQISAIEPVVAARAFVAYKCCPSTGITEWLHNELDTIAAAAPAA
jgi:hypothetical protein